MESLPGKKPLIKLSYRPPNYEAPLEYFRTPITPNDEFFVRYHLSDIPEVDAKTYKIEVGGDGASGQSVNHARRSEETAGRRADRRQSMLGQPARPFHAACRRRRMGLRRDGLRALEGRAAQGRPRQRRAQAGSDRDRLQRRRRAGFDKTPDFIKSLPVWKAMDEPTLIAYEMNGAPLPHFNGFPARLIVPGWTGTYWMKHLVSDHGADQAARRFLDETGLPHSGRRIPASWRASSAQETATNTPITEIVVNSLITSHRDGANVKPGKVTVSGLAWDGGYGISRVEISTDGGKTWSSRASARISAAMRSGHGASSSPRSAARTP